MTRIIWSMIKNKLVLPYLELPIEYYDLSVQSRDATEDKITVQAAEAIKKYSVGIKCAGITPDAARVKEFNLKKMWKSPNGTIRNILNGTVFREPIIIGNIPRIVPQWTSAHHRRTPRARRPVQGSRPAARPGQAGARFTPADGSAPQRHEVYDFKGDGVGMAMYNTKSSIEAFATSCFEYALQKKMPLYLSTKNTILKQYDGMFMDTFSKCYATSTSR
jgi:isocitrate dehydrogenase